MTNDSQNLILGNIIHDESESSDFISLLSAEEEEQMNKETLPEMLPILPLRNMVLFPGVVIPITVGRDKSIQLLKEVYKSKNRFVGVVAQKKSEIEEPGFDDIYHIGTVATIMRMIKMPDGSTMAVIQGKRRFNLNSIVNSEPYLTGLITPFVEPKPEKDDETQVLAESIKELAQKIISLSPAMPSEAAIAIKNINSPTFLVNFTASNLNAELEVKQEILRIIPYKERAKKVLEALSKDYKYVELKSSIESKVRGDLEKQQRDFFLQQQIKAIQEELGADSPEREIENLLEAAKSKKWDAKVQEAFNKEIERLRRINPMAPDYSIQISYLQT